MERQKSKCRVEVFSRVTGFYRPVQSFNPGKVSEVKDRKKYDLKKND
jgi:ribonucleoside-triphosphate reductase